MLFCVLLCVLVFSSAVVPQAAPTAQPKKKPADDVATENNNNPDRFCSACQASFNNPLMAQQHYAGKKHRKQMTKLKLMETYGPSTAPGQSTEPGRGGGACAGLKRTDPLVCLCSQLPR